MATILLNFFFHWYFSKPFDDCLQFQRLSSIWNPATHLALIVMPKNLSFSSTKTWTRALPACRRFGWRIWTWNNGFWILKTCGLVNWFIVRIVLHNWTTVCIVSLIARFHGSECPLCYKSFRLEITVYPSSEVNYLTCFGYVIKVNIASCSLGDCNVMLCYLPCHKWLNSGFDVETCVLMYMQLPGLRTSAFII